MKTLVTLVCLSCVLMFTACHSAMPARSDGNLRSEPLRGISFNQPGTSTWAAYLQVMSDRERNEFQAIEDVERRELYIRRQGIDLRYAMSDRLRVGMTQAMVKDGLADVIQDWRYESNEGRLYGSAYNGDGVTHMYAVFKPVQDQEGLALVNWGSFTEQQAEEERQLHRLEAVLSTRLNRALKKGMTPNEITGAYTQAQQELQNYEAEARQRRSDQVGEDYAGFNAPSSSDYQVEAEWLRAHAHRDFYEVLNMKRDYLRREGSVEYWYHTLPYRDDSDYFIVVEYRFDSNQLISWYVYHTDFLGFGR